MAYGKIKADAIIRDNSGSDEEITMATIVGLDSGKASLTGATFTGDVTLNAQQELRLADSDSSNYIAFASPATVSTNSTWTLPSDAPAADDVLTVSSVSSNNPTLAWAPAGGKTLQVKVARSTSIITTTRSTTDYTGTVSDGNQVVALTMTRQSATSIIVVMANAHGYITANLGACNALFAGSTGLASFIGNGYSADAMGGTCMGTIASADVGSGSVTYQLRTLGTRGSGTHYVNSWSSGSGSVGAGQSQLIVYEIEP